MFLFGDSLAVGLDPFVRKLAQERGIGYSSQSKGGTTMRNWLAQATSLRAAMAPAQAVFISLGTNDTYSNLTPEELRKDAETILALARENGRRVLWLLPPKLPKQDRATPEIKATGVDVFESALIDIPMGGDLIHPTGTGYAMWAGLMWRQATCGDEKPPQVAAGMMPARPPSWLKRVPSPDRVRTIRARRRR
jgi:lysophospholipase L1-like esterase